MTANSMESWEIEEIDSMTAKVAPSSDAATFDLSIKSRGMIGLIV